MAKISINLGSGTVDKSNDVVVGIDLGTTNSLIAVIDKETKAPITLADDANKHVITPSILYRHPDGHFVVGDAAKEMLLQHPEQTVYSIKRLLGKSFNDIADFESDYGFKIIDENEDRLVKIKLGNQFYSPIELSAEILKDLKNKAEKKLNQSISKAVITVPAYFNDAQRQATRDAGKLAGLEVLRIVNEPTAASLAYGIGLDTTIQKTVAVYDLGGGTFDISILRIEDGIFEVLSTNGDTFLGGDDFDKAIVRHWSKTFNIDYTTLTPSKKQEIRLLAEKAKVHVGGKEIFETSFDGGQLVLSKETFVDLIKPLVNKTIDCCRNALSDSGLKLDEIQEVVFVGGSTRIPYVIESVSTFFNHSTLENKLNPDEIVALGAAIEADILAGNRRDLLLLDVTPLSLGIETLGGLMDVIIPRNSRVPFKAGRNYTTSIDGQVNLKISVFQGERDKVIENRKLAEFILTGIPAMPAGIPKVEIAFILDADGILKVKAKELRSGVEQTIDVKPQYGLTDKEVEQMLQDSLSNAQKDMDYRVLHEAINESEYLIKSTEKFVANNKSDIRKDEIKEINNLVATLSGAIESKDKDAIQLAQDELNEYTKPFAEGMMDKTIATALKGKTIE
ncbi:MAG: molecular chaperone HscA [Bacteroidia bacterium]|jgi:molecular chaperone HscA